MANDEFETSEVQNDAESDYIIDPVSGNLKSIAFGLFNKMIGYEHHYNTIQNRYKTLAATWMLMTFLGIGYFLSGFEVGIPFNSLIGVMILCLLSSTGIFLLWYLDSGIYHKLLEAVFMETFSLEKKFLFLGKSHENMMNLIYQGKKIPVFFHGLFYSSFIVFLIIIAMISVCIYLFGISKMYAVVVGFLFILSLLIFRVLHKKATQYYETYEFIQEHKKEFPEDKDH